MWARYALLATAVVASYAILRLPRHSVTSVLAVLLAATAAAVIVYLEHRAPRLRAFPVAAAVGAIVVASIVAPPRTSNDLWSYTMYGRAVSAHGTSPYDTVPAHFRSDPFLRRVSPRWRHRGSVYGTVFVGLAAAGTFAAGDSVLLSRLFFQILAALALLAILIVVWRTTRSVAAVAFLGLNPLLAVIVVNGGHNDALVGLGLLVAALLAANGRWRTAGAVIGVTALIKLTAGLALIGLLVWAWRHHQRRVGVAAAGTAVGVVAVGYLPVVAGASQVLGSSDKTVTNGSPWNPLVDQLLHHDAWRNVPNPLAPNATLTAVFYTSAVLVLALACGLGWLAARERRPAAAVGVTLAAYPIGAEYAFPWYAAWALPVFATDRLTPIAWVAWVESIVLVAALKLPIAVTGSMAHSTLRVVLTYVAPPALLVAFIVVAIRQYWGPERATRTSGFVVTPRDDPLEAAPGG
jgi:Glycosyltransferase family 87